MRLPELSDFDDVIEFEVDTSSSVVVNAYKRLANMHGTTYYSSSEGTEIAELLIGFGKDSFELFVAEEAGMPVEYIIQLSRRAMYDFLVLRNDISESH